MKRNWRNFHEHYKHFIGPIFRYVVVRVPNREKAEDLTSDIFLKALEHFEDFDDTRPFSNWIYTIAHNHIITYLKQQKHTIPIDDIESLQNPFNQETTYALQEQFEHIRVAMKKLPYEKQQLIEMKYLLGFSYREIGEIIGKDENNVKVATYRSLMELKKHISL